MIEKIGLVISLFLNILLIWDKFKPEKIYLKCELNRDPIHYYIHHLLITNPSTKQLKINRILLNDSEIRSPDIREFPFILPPQNDINFRITSTKDNPKPTNCKIEVLKKRKSQTLEFPI